MRLLSLLTCCVIACSSAEAELQPPQAAGSAGNTPTSGTGAGAAGPGLGGMSPGVAGTATTLEGAAAADAATGGAVAAGAATGGAAAGDGGTALGGTTTGGVAATSFVHPGVLLNRGMLDFVKARAMAGQAPWAPALTAAKNSKYGSLAYQAKPRENVQCGPTSNPDIGCTDEKNDVIAAYTHALLWYYTGNKANADKAVRIMDAWSAVLKMHSLDNHQLQAAWCAEIFVRAAEIIRHTNAGWSEDGIVRFETMLKTAYLPEVKDGSTRTGNWDTSAIDAALNIAVFLNDRAQFDKAVALWKARTPAYIYLTTDGALPLQPPRENARSESSLKGYWFDPQKFVDGLSQESCRDRPGGGTPGFGHAQYGVAAILNAAETARIQGVDLFALEQKRLVAFLELHAKHLNGASTSALCTTAIASVGADPMWEIGYNAYTGVLGGDLPQTWQLLQDLRPTDATHHMAWETLTHGSIGNAGL